MNTEGGEREACERGVGGRKEDSRGGSDGDVGRLFYG